jgi:site-specific DNA-cytosine methylase
MKTYGSLFTGGGLADMGAIAAGYQPIWGVEYIPKIADVARLNGLDVITANILDLDPRNFKCPDLFHASPPCPNFSVAKQGGVETALDIALAEKVAEFITVLRPPTCTIENVQAYIKSRSYKIILKAMQDCGYMYDAKILNSADFGVPQTRRRLFVRAVMGGMVPYLPAPAKWVGWYAAIEDIIDTLPESKFADWQLARLPDFCNGALFTPNKRDDDLMFAGADDPAHTITSNRNQYNIKAFLMNNNRTGMNWIQETDALFPECPSPTISANASMPRAFIVDGGNASKLGEIYHFENRPMTTVTAAGQPRAFLVDGKPRNYAGELNIIDTPTPTPTLTASQDKHPFRAWLEYGRVVSMTPRALARFQSVPDSYILPERRTLAGRIIGNGVPPLEYEKIAGCFQ